MRSLKDAGLDEVRSVKRRATRSLAMGRIGKSDHDYIVHRLDEIEARMVSMQERDPSRREF